MKNQACNRFFRPFSFGVLIRGNDWMCLKEINRGLERRDKEGRNCIGDIPAASVFNEVIKEGKDEERQSVSMRVKYDFANKTLD